MLVGMQKFVCNCVQKYVCDSNQPNIRLGRTSTVQMTERNAPSETASQHCPVT